MAVTLHNSDNAGLFDRIGYLLGGINDINALLGASTTSGVTANWVTRANTLDTRYGASPAQQKVLDGLYQSLSSWQGSQTGFLTAIRTIAQNTLIEMVHADTPLASKTVANAMTVLIQQMVAASDDVNASSSSAAAQASVGSPTGTPSIVVSIKRTDGRTREYLIPETIRFTCSSDSGTGATADREPFLVTTPASVSEPLAWNWPAGSGINKSITTVDASVDAGSNLLTNSDFESFTSNTPANWTVLVGAAGTDILAAGSGDAMDSSTNALEFTYHSGVPLSSIAQTMNNSGGTTGTLKPNTVYCLNSFMKKSSSGLSGAGTVEISLVDGTNTQITDDAGNDCKITQVASSLTTSYAAVKGSFATPKTLPASGYKLRVRMSVAIADSGESVFIDNLALAEGVELYAGGPVVAVFAGATAPVKNDAYTVAISNTYGGFQKGFDRLFGMRTLGLQLPSDTGGSETVPDSYIS